MTVTAFNRKRREQAARTRPPAIQVVAPSPDQAAHELAAAELAAARQLVAEADAAELVEIALLAQAEQAAIVEVERVAAEAAANALDPNGVLPGIDEGVTSERVAGVLDPESMTKAELLAVAEAAGVEVSPKMTKAQIAEAIGPVVVPVSDTADEGNATPESE